MIRARNQELSKFANRWALFDDLFQEGDAEAKLKLKLYRHGLQGISTERLDVIVRSCTANADDCFVDIGDFIDQWIVQTIPYFYRPFGIESLQPNTINL